MSTNRIKPLSAALAAAGLLLATACNDDTTAQRTEANPTAAPAPNTSTTTTTVTVEPTTTVKLDTSSQVSYSYAYDPPDGNVDDLLDNFPANPPDPANGKLGLFSAHGVMHLTGDFAGTMWYVYGASEHPSGLATGGTTAVSIGLFLGSAGKCGEGTAVIVESTTYPESGDGHGSWKVLDGFGTGELAQLSGSGTTVRRDGLDSGKGDVSARIACDDSLRGGDQAATPGDHPVSFSWRYQGADNTTDLGGVPWQQTYDPATHADPATGKLGLIHGHGTTVYDGDVTGTSRRVWLAVEHPAGWMAVAGTRVELTQFVGTVTGCGQGTMILLGTASFGPGASTPQVMIKADYPWTILPGFGTGDLQTATGQGTGETSENATGGTANLKGTISCRS